MPTKISGLVNSTNTAHHRVSQSDGCGGQDGKGGDGSKSHSRGGQAGREGQRN
jgi:hypothetical protein